MSHIDGSISTIDLEDLQPSDYFKIGVAHAEQNVKPTDSAYITYAPQQAYLDGYAYGLAMKVQLYQRRDYA
jgi:hypothetical protein